MTMKKYGFLVVEGPHDAEFAYRLLRPCGLKRVQREADVPTYLKPLIPREYPPDGDLLKRMSTPLFLTSDTHAIAICRANGDVRLVETVQENIAILDPYQLTGMGIFLDADREKTVSANERYAVIQKGMTDLGYTLPLMSGNVTTVAPRIGTYVFPDNLNSGTLEDLLIECATVVYPSLLASAVNHVETGNTDKDLLADDLKDFKKPTGRNKAIVGSIASILRPGKALQVSIQDNRWLSGNTLVLPKILAIQNFLKSLFDLT